MKNHQKISETSLKINENSLKKQWKFANELVEIH